MLAKLTPEETYPPIVPTETILLITPRAMIFPIFFTLRESLDNVVKILYELSGDKKELHRVHVISIVSKDPDSFLPAEIKGYYGARE